MRSNLSWAGLVACAGLVGGQLVATPAVGQTPGSFRECAFIESKWMAEHAPPMIAAKFVGTTEIPAGWTPVSGSTGSGLSILVCR